MVKLVSDGADHHSALDLNGLLAKLVSDGADHHAAPDLNGLLAKLVSTGTDHRAAPAPFKFVMNFLILTVTIEIRSIRASLGYHPFIG